MNPFYILIYGPAILAMLIMLWLASWVAIAPHKAAQNTQRRKLS